MVPMRYEHFILFLQILDADVTFCINITREPVFYSEEWINMLFERKVVEKPFLMNFVLINKHLNAGYLSRFGETC